MKIFVFSLISVFLSFNLQAEEPTTQPSTSSLTASTQPSISPKEEGVSIEASIKTTEEKLHEIELPIIEPRPIFSAPKGEEEPTLAGFYKGNFFIRDANNMFRISPKLRLQFHAIAAFPDEEAPIKPTLFARRARPEVSFGLLKERVQVYLAADLGKSGPIATDIWIRTFIHPWFSMQLGQFTVPFTLESITSNKYTDFIERAAINTNLIPTEKDLGLMFFGGFKDQLVVYHAGIFNGSGASKKNENGSFDIIGRVASKPLVRSDSILKDLRLGGSFALSPRHDSKDPRMSHSVSKDWLQSSTKKRFFKLNGLVGEGLQTRVAGEFSLPIDKFIIRSEAIVMSASTHTAMGDQIIRKKGSLEAFGADLTLGYWVIGKRHLKRYGGVPKHKVIPKIVPKLKTEQSIFHMQILLRGESLFAEYTPGKATDNSVKDAENGGRYRWYVMTVGTNLWWTKHIRLSFNYTFNHLSRNKTDTDSIVLHEIGTRAGIHF